MKFRATLMQSGKTATGINVPEDVVLSFNVGKRVAVNVTINGYSYRSTVAPYGGDYMLPVSAEVRAGAGIAAGDEIEITLELDTQPREVTVPPDLQAALDANPAAKEKFGSLSFSNKQRHVLSVEGTKNPETRQRRIEKAISELS